MIRKTYSHVGVYEITGMDEEEAATPFFEVEVGGDSYNSLSMGRGELSALHLIWRLDRLASGSIVLIEEPESHLAVYSHDALVYVLAKIVIDRNLSLICASHTPSFFRRLPEGSVAVIESSPTPSITTSLSSGEAARQLGVAPEGSVHLVCEDECAALLLGEMLELADPDLRRRVTISYSVDGESGVRRIVEGLKTAGDRVAVIGVLDGDQRAAGNAPHTFLPGDAAPEIVLQQALSLWRLGGVEWRPPFPGGAQRLRAVLARLDGIDHHDWIDGLASEYGGKAYVIKALAPLIASGAAEGAHLDELVIAVRSRLPVV
ncbi:hypothetical protein [Cellulomonas shaoxiangyii]|uniref:ATP-binding protein n=1 Tax=Cellulomonas shaoxiangyii TaxID=2566013 RepID=A0A4P7SK32_9CELL|nr:hypothetical protein [Cellulomonas shaoxiangyii]QCB94500.1 hypothetical protein E5225_13990 [Cellulomonas shaoxiangyii]